MPSASGEVRGSARRDSGAGRSVGSGLRASLILCAGALAFSGAATGPGSSLDAPFGQTPALRSRAGVAVSATPESSQAGAEILAAGGNAVDAAVAVAFALAVTYPQAGNLAGGGFLVLRTSTGELHALDFRETAPAATRKSSFVDTGLDPLTSMLAVGTPGSVAGYAEVHRRFGKLPWSRLVAPAIRLARDGFVVPPGLSRELASEKAHLERWPASRQIFLPGGAPPVPGSRLVQPDLARTLEIVAREGAAGFHRGPVAAALVRAVRAGGGLLGEDDLAGYRPVWRAPEAIDFQGLRLVTMPLPSSGGFVLRSVLAQLEAAGDGWKALGTAPSIHLLAEAERRAYADRNRYLGDGDCTRVPLARLLAPARLTALGLSIDPRRATPSAAVAALAPIREREETTHLVVATPDGEAVSLTTTLNGLFGNCAVVPGLGVLLNNEMDDFATRPDVPNLFGLVQGDPNAVRAGARPLSSMAPSIVLQDGRPVLVLGAPGGSTIPTSVLHVFLAAGPLGLPLDAAVARSRTHHQHLPDVIHVERGSLPAGVRRELEAMGHALRDREPIGKVHAVAFEPGGTLLGAADPRGYGRAASPSRP